LQQVGDILAFQMLDLVNWNPEIVRKVCINQWRKRKKTTHKKSIMRIFLSLFFYFGMQEGKVESYDKTSQTITFKIDPAFLPQKEEPEEGEDMEMEKGVEEEIEDTLAISRSQLKDIRIITKATPTN
jgi:hypothetical protein